MHISAACLTCAQTQSYGLACPACQGVGNKDAAWGTLKTHYR
jgi:hypothetical protein